MPVFADRVKVQTSTTGSSTITLSASPVAGFQAFPSTLNGETVGYVIENGTSFEIGTGTYTHSGLTLTRTLRSSSTGSLLSLSGTSTVFLSPTYSDLQIVEFFSSTTDLPAAADSHGRIYHVHGEGAMYFAHGGAWYKLANATNATTSAAGLMSSADKTKLDGVATSANNFTLPTASSSALGGIKVGGNLSIDSNGILSASSSGASSANFSSTILADATANQTVYSSLTYIQNREAIYVNGVKMLRGTDYTNNSAGNTITFAAGLAAGDKVELVDHGSLVAGTKVYATTTAMTNDTANILTGQLGFVSANSGLYIFNGSGWYLTETANSAPTITGVSQTTNSVTAAMSAGATFDLNTANHNTVITITASDSELNTTLTYSHAVTNSTSLGSAATVTQGTGSNVNQFTIDPSNNSAHAGTFQLTFTVTDGISSATFIQNFELSFNPINSALIRLGFNNNLTNSGTNSSVSAALSTGGAQTYSTSIKKIGTHAIDFGNNNNGAVTVSGYTASTTYSIGMWFYLNTYSVSSSSRYLFTSADVGVSTGQSLYADAGSPNSGAFWFADGVTDYNGASATITGQTWHHVVMTSGSNGTKLYFNGSLLDSGSGTKTLETTITIGEITANRNASSSIYNLKGAVDNFFVHSSELTSTEVSTIYNDTTTNF